MQGKKVIITGANRGLGKAMVAQLGRLGATVYMVCRDENRGKESCEELKGQGLDVKLKIADIGKLEDIMQIAKEITQETEVIDVLINNAGINIDKSDTRISNITPETLDQTMDVNIRGPLFMCQQFLPLLEKAESGRIINFSSGLGQLTVPRMGYFPAYSISKTAINGLTKNLAHEVKDTNILVFSVDPGWVRTDLGGPQAPLSIEEGIQTPVFLATEPAENLHSGEFYKEKKVLGW